MKIPKKNEWNHRGQNFDFQMWAINFVGLPVYFHMPVLLYLISSYFPQYFNKIHILKRLLKYVPSIVEDYNYSSWQWNVSMVSPQYGAEYHLVINVANVVVYFPIVIDYLVFSIVFKASWQYKMIPLRDETKWNIYMLCGYTIHWC